MNAPRVDLLFVGSSGLIGRLALLRLLEHAIGSTRRVFTPVRRASGLTHPNLIEIVDGADARERDENIDASLHAHDAAISSFLCAIGSTLAQAGSQEAFAAIDRDLVLHMAALALRHGAERAVVVSSIGADASTRNFYLRTKGRMERDLGALGFRRCDFLQPSLLMGAREGTDRGGEQFAQKIAPIANNLLIGPLRRYRAIPAQAVADAMAKLADAVGTGVHRHDHDQIQALASA